MFVDLFESSPTWCCVLVAERGGAALGAVAFRRGYWSWSGRTLVLTGLYVRPPARTHGIGERLVLELCRLALAENAQLDWHHPRVPAAAAVLSQFWAHRNNTFDRHYTMKMPLNSITLAANGRVRRHSEAGEGVHSQSPDGSVNKKVTAHLARPGDMAAINDMIRELAVYQEHPEGPQLTLKDFEEDGFSSSAWFFAFVAERGGAAVGMVMGNRAWDGARRHYLQSLYVRPNARRCGVAELLIKEFCKYSLAKGVRHIDLNVADDNVAAQNLYRRLQAVFVPEADGPVAYRLSKSKIKDVVLQSQLEFR